MTMHHLLIDLASTLRHLDIPPELEAWLITTYGWEPVDDFYDPSELIDIVEGSYKQYVSGGLDVTVPDDATLWKDRAEAAAYFLKSKVLEIDFLHEECNRFMALLDENGIDY